MARLTPLEMTDVTGKALDIYKEIEAAFGKVPNLFKTYAHHPVLLEANWNKVKTVMMNGALRDEIKQTIALLVSKDNGCAYCVAAHLGALKSLGLSNDEIGRIETNIDEANFSSREKAIIAFARKANTDPLHVSDDEFQALRENGVSDAEIVEALGVMEVFTSFNKFLDSLQVDIDFIND